MSRRTTIAIAAAAMLAACAEAPPPRDQYYRLLPEQGESAPPTAPTPALAGTLVVRRYTADGVLGQRALVHAGAQTPQSLFQYNYHFWADPPPILLQDYTIDALRAAGVATRVVSPEVALDADFVLAGRARRLEHLTGPSPAVAVSLEFVLTRRRDGTVLLLETYGVTAPAADPGIDAAVAAMNAALGEIHARLVADVARL